MHVYSAVIKPLGLHTCSVQCAEVLEITTGVLCRLYSNISNLVIGFFFAGCSAGMTPAW